MKCVNITLWDLLGCFHYILNAPRMSSSSQDIERKRNFGVIKGLNCYKCSKMCNNPKLDLAKINAYIKKFYQLVLKILSGNEILA